MITSQFASEKLTAERPASFSLWHISLTTSESLWEEERRGRIGSCLQPLVSIGRDGSELNMQEQTVGCYTLVHSNLLQHKWKAPPAHSQRSPPSRSLKLRSHPGLFSSDSSFPSLNEGKVKTKAKKLRERGRKGHSEDRWKELRFKKACHWKLFHNRAATPIWVMGLVF